MEHAAETLNELNERSSSKIVIKRIERIIEKYREVWRVIHEPVQNAVDAVQNREDIEQGEVELKLNIESQGLQIKDNGRGFPQDLKLLLPDATDKDNEAGTLGYQGVGLKSVIYTSESFRLLANTGGPTWGYEIQNAAQYLHSLGDTEAPMQALSEERTEQGTTIQVNFERSDILTAIEQIIENVTESETNFRMRWEEVREENFALKKADNSIEEFEYLVEYYLLTQTYMASVSRLTNSRINPSVESHAKPVILSVEIDFEGLSEDDTEIPFLKEVIQDIARSDSEIVSVEVENKFIDFAEIVGKIESQDRRSIAFDIYDFDIKPRGIEGNPTLKDQAYRKIMTPDYTKDEENIEERYAEYISLLDPGSGEHKERMTRLFENFFGKVLSVYILIGRMGALQEKYVGNNYGMKFIAANGTPTSHELTPRSSNQSFYFNPITFILNVDAKLNEGKKELVDESLKRKAYKFFREAFESTLNRLTQEFVRSERRSDPPPSEDLVDKPKLSIEGIDLKRKPIDENTLIALFYQLLIKEGRSLPTYGLSGSAIFDGKFTYVDENIRSNNDLLSLEFKVDLIDLVNDFDSTDSKKKFLESDLLIVWSDRVTSAQKQDWKVVNRPNRK